MNKDEALKLLLEVLEALETIANAMPFPVGKSAITAIKQALAAQPAVPDAIHHTDLSEHPQYIEGWNDCRALMLEGRKP
jgi:hypothetical protein